MVLAQRTASVLKSVAAVCNRRSLTSKTTDLHRPPPRRVSIQVIFCLGFSIPLIQAGSLQQRIDAAPPGATLTVEPGTTTGPIVIEKPLTLLGNDHPRIDGGGTGNVVTIRAADVTVRGFVIANSGTNLSKDHAAIHVTADRATLANNRIADSLHGIYLKKVRGARVTGNTITGRTTLPPPVLPSSTTIVADDADLCAIPLNVNSRGNGIHLWNSEENVLEDNVITETRDGMYFSFTNHTQVRRNVIHGVRYGLHYMYSDNNTFEKNTFTDNAAGAAIMYSKGLLIRDNAFTANRGFRAYGLLLNSVDNTRLEANRISGNTVGIYLENSNANTVLANDIADNTIGIRFTASSDTNRFSRNEITGNLHPVELAGGQSESNLWSVAGVGNRWGNSEPLDLDGDGVGDLPHREPDLLGHLRRPFPLVGLLSGSPALELLRFANSRVALPGIEAIEDDSPLTSAFGRDRR